MQYHNDLFDRLPGEKQRRILETATDEFSKLGYQTANINVIAKKCGVSVGALYKYFGTKENLFLSVCSAAVRQLSDSLEDVERTEGGLTEKIEKLLRIIQSHSRKNQSLINLYNEITTEANRELAARLSFQMESISAGYYRRLLEQAREDGRIPRDTDSATAAYCLDNLFMALQFSYASEYYRNRMKIYVSDDIFGDDERVVRGMMQFIKRALNIAE